MLKNMWDKVTLYCLNHDEPLPMQVISNTEYIKTPFHGCMDYIPVHGKIPCPNRLNMEDYYKLVEQFLEVVEKNPFDDYTNYSFTPKKTYHKLFVKVLKFTESEIRLGIKNISVFGGTVKK